jgi:hypothetical protein
MTNLFLRISDVLSFSKYLCFLWISITFIACSKPPPLKLTSTQRTEVDTLYLRIVNPLGKQLDSICEANKVKKIQVLLDSMRNVRLSEEENLRLKYLQNENK